jgi:N-acetylmuramoyl-L-alanine amidase
MKFVAKLLLSLLLLGVSGASAQEQPLRALARVITEKSTITDRIFGGVDVELALTQGVPFRVFAQSNPNRIVLDFREVVWSSHEAQSINESSVVKDLKFGIQQPGWTRLVIPVDTPMIVKSASLNIDQETGSGSLWVRLGKVDQQQFDAEVASNDIADWITSSVKFEQTPRERQKGDRAIVVAIDPGHGGPDPGAVVGGHSEKELVLQFAQELRETLAKTGRFEAFLTRDADTFVSLTGRISNARHGKADVFMSLHADALASGNASGITIYTLSSKASDAAAQQLATQLDRADLLAGIDLVEQDETVASVLMDLARIETNARSTVLAQKMVSSIAFSTKKSRKHPHLSAGFTVLKAPDIPSILIELGFLTNKRDLRNLLNERWRQSVQVGIVDGLSKWSVEDAAQAGLLRK